MIPPWPNVYHSTKFGLNPEYKVRYSGNKQKTTEKQTYRQTNRQRVSHYLHNFVGRDKHARGVRNKNFISVRIPFKYLKKNLDSVRHKFSLVRFEKN